MTSHTWTDIRSLRATGVGRADKKDRRKTFSAALEQAERLWEGSLQVSAAASPMLKFYALAQAGRAIVASRAPKGNGWRPKPNHGLAFEMDQSSSVGPLDAVTIRAEGEGLAQLVARTTGSPLLREPVRLGDLIASTPTAFAAFPDDLNPALSPAIVRFDNGNWIATQRVVVTVGPVPPTLLARRHLGASPTQSAGYVTEIRDHDDVRNWLATYPSLAMLGPPSEVLNVNPMSFDRRPDPSYSVRCVWPRDVLPDWQRERSHVDWLFDNDRWSPNHDGLVLPAVGGNDRALTALMGWWLVLYGLSMLSRYYPETWVALLDVDSSELAVPMSALLERETQIIPALIYDELTRGDVEGTVT